MFFFFFISIKIDYHSRKLDQKKLENLNAQGGSIVEELGMIDFVW